MTYGQELRDYMNSLLAPPEAEDFYPRAYARMGRFMLALGILASVALLVAFGWQMGAGFAVGAAVAVINFYWLKRAVGALAERGTQPGAGKPSRGVLVRFGLRYLLVGLAVYVIFGSSSLSLYGLFAGLSLPVAAVGCEAAYEIYAAMRRGV
jgi:hypothetical protein